MTPGVKQNSENGCTWECFLIFRLLSLVIAHPLTALLRGPRTKETSSCLSRPVLSKDYLIYATAAPAVTVAGAGGGGAAASIIALTTVIAMRSLRTQY